MKRISNLRSLAIERLSSRLAFAAVDFLVLDDPVSELTSNFSANDTLSGSQAAFREMSIVLDNRIESIALHPQANLLQTTSQSLALPLGGVESVVEQAIGRESGYGFVLFNDGRTETVLWITADLPVLLGSQVPLAARQLPDQSVDIALDTGSATRVLRFSSTGQQSQAFTFEGSRYTSAVASVHGLTLLGTVDDLPVAATINAQFAVDEVELSVPDGNSSAFPIGLGVWNDNLVFTGTAVDGLGETRLVKWNQQGVLVDESVETDIWALRSSGSAMLVDTEQSKAVILHDAALASLLGVPSDQPISSQQIKVISDRGFVNSSITEVVEHDGELFLGIIATDSNGAIVHGLVAATIDNFPSPWKNYRQAEDVNQNQLVSPTDALLIINQLNTQGGRSLNASDLSLEHRLDVNGSGSLSPVDALLVINLLNRRRGGEGEDEQGYVSPKMIQSYGLFEDLDEIRVLRGLFAPKALHSKALGRGVAALPG